MPYKISKRAHCVDCGKALSLPSSVRCKPCSGIAQRGKAVSQPFCPNDYRIEGDAAYLVLVDRDGAPKAEAIIDAEDLPRALQYRWAYGSGYVKCSREVALKTTNYLLHRVIMGAEHGDPVVIDHENRNTLDCRKSNLRRGDTPFNAANRVKLASSQFPGVYWDKRNRRWVAQGAFNGTDVFLGRYESEIEAGSAYRVWRESVGLPPLVDPEGEFRNVDLSPKLVRPIPRESSRYIGVKYCKQTGRWAVSFQENGRTIWLGRHDTEDVAAAIAAEWLTARGRPTVRIVTRLQRLDPLAPAGAPRVANPADS